MPRFLVILFILAQSNTLFGSDFGITGLIDIPSARMSEDGTLVSTVSAQSRHKSTSLTYQVTPWLQGTFRYTGSKEFFHWDRNFEIKARVLQERKYVPEISIGIRDIAGTGKWSSEYIAATKKINNLDLTLGVGWGRIAGEGDFKNPFILFSDSFSNRNSNVGRGGQFSFDSFFSGDRAALFGGMIYSFDSYPVELILEYNPDQYNWEIGRGGSIPKGSLNTAIKYSINPSISLMLSRKHQQEWGINFSASFNTKSKPSLLKSQQFVSSLDTSNKNLPAQVDINKWYDLLLFDVERSGILLLEAGIDEDSKAVTIVMGNANHTLWIDALGKMTQLANMHLPSRIKKLKIIIEEEGHRLQTISLHRDNFTFNQTREILPKRIEIERVPGHTFIQHKTDFFTRKIIFDYSLSTRTQLFDPDDPLRYQLYAQLGFRMALPENWLLRGMYAQNITHNFDESRRKSNSVLQHVRSDVVEYLTQGESGIDSLFLEKRGNVFNDTYYRVYSGILEQMYSGMGGEILHHPFQSRFAYGLSANIVKQRDYDRSLSHLDYQTLTAFASVYYATPFHNLDLALHAGKYLAKDTGATLEIRRTFSNGWMVGLWATKTNVSAKRFGEGSFDKGMYFSIPLNKILDSGNRDSFRTYLRPIQRDGGQRLEDFSGNIWWDIRGARYDAFIKTTSRNFFSGFSTKKTSETNQNVFTKYYRERS